MWALKLRKRICQNLSWCTVILFSSSHWSSIYLHQSTIWSCVLGIGFDFWGPGIQSVFALILVLYWWNSNTPLFSLQGCLSISSLQFPFPLPFHSKSYIMGMCSWFLLPSVLLESWLSWTLCTKLLCIQCTACSTPLEVVENHPQGMQWQPGSQHYTVSLLCFLMLSLIRCGECYWIISVPGVAAAFVREKLFPLHCDLKMHMGI